MYSNPKKIEKSFIIILVILNGMFFSFFCGTYCR